MGSAQGVKGVAVRRLPGTLAGCLRYVEAVVDANEDACLAPDLHRQTRSELAKGFAEHAMEALCLVDKWRLQKITRSRGGSVLGRDSTNGAFGYRVVDAVREAVSDRLYVAALNRVFELQQDARSGPAEKPEKGLSVIDCVERMFLNMHAQEERVAKLGDVAQWEKTNVAQFLAEAFAREALYGLGIDWGSLQDVFASDPTLWEGEGEGDSVESQMLNVLIWRMAEAGLDEMAMVYEAMAEDSAVPSLEA